jgi:hypothetical protein
MSRKSIDDHSFWAGGPGKDSVLPDGAKTKRMDSEEGAGSLARYADTSEEIAGMQKKSVGKAEKYSQPIDQRY